MSLYIKDLFLLKAFANAKIIAGKRGIVNEVKHISVADGPVLTSEVSSMLSNEGDLYLAHLYDMKDDVDAMHIFFKDLIETKSAGICVTNQYMNDLPLSIKEFCDKNNYPVLFIDWKVPYADIIEGISKVLFLDNKQDNYEMIIDSLLDEVLDEKQRNSYLDHLMQGFVSPSEIFSVYLRRDQLIFIEDKIKKNIITIENNYFSLKYKNGYLFCFHFPKITKKIFKNKLGFILDHFYDEKLNDCVGISNVLDSETIGQRTVEESIRQALITCDINNKKGIAYYKDLGLYKILYPFRYSNEFTRFEKEIIGPIKEFDELYNGEIYITLVSFIHNNRNYKKTAKELHAHENTIRYRIKKGIELINSNQDENEILESLSICLKIIEIKEDISL